MLKPAGYYCGEREDEIEVVTLNTWDAHEIRPQ